MSEAANTSEIGALVQLEMSSSWRRASQYSVGLGGGSMSITLETEDWRLGEPCNDEGSDDSRCDEDRLLQRQGGSEQNIGEDDDLAEHDQVRS
ncbi:MAG: hypothetical protein JWP34_5208 [Massilia sp.]|jgi:hypothetical protein|nr:hypothetical protein [Massilia sp.]